MYDIIIVGAGPAGLSAAIYITRSGNSVLLLEAQNYGGQIINTPEIENYPGIKQISGFEFATNLYEQVIALGAEIKYEKVAKISDDGKNKIVETESNKYQCKAIILATGAKNRLLGVENEEKFLGQGVSYCATCDGAFFKGKTVAVVGGGNTALLDAGFLSSYCKKVYIIHRRDSFRGEEKLVEQLKKKDNVEFILKSRVIKLLGGNKLEGIVVENVEEKEKSTVELDGVFVAIGQSPENTAFSNLVELNQGGYISALENCETKTRGVFTAGDCRTKKVRQLSTAAADGAVAAIAASEYIEEIK